MEKDWECYHIGIVVRNLEKAVEGCKAIGATATRTMAGFPPNMRVVFVRLGDIEVEYFQPLEGESVAGDFLERHGEGVSHLCYYVKDLEAEIKELAGRGVKPFRQWESATGARVAYFAPNGIGGIQLELVQRPPAERN